MSSVSSESESRKLTGLGIQPYVKNGEEKDSVHQNSTDEGAKMFNITNQVRKIIRGKQQRYEKQKKCPVAGTTIVSFTLPKDLVSVVDNIELYTSEDLIRPKTNCRYTIRQRIKGWTIERCQRETKRYDSYFIHKESRGSSRSVVEVINFILYEIYPNKPTPKPRKKKAEEESSFNGSLGVGSTPIQKKVGMTRKSKKDGEQGSTVMQRKVGRPRKMVDEEQRTSLVSTMKKLKKKMEKEVIVLVPIIKEEKLKGVARETSWVIDETMKYSETRFMDYEMKKMANENYYVQITRKTTENEKRTEAEEEINPIDEVMEHFQHKLIAEPKDNIYEKLLGCKRTRCYSAGKRNILRNIVQNTNQEVH